MMGSHLVDGGMLKDDFMRKRSSDLENETFCGQLKANAFEETDNTSLDASSLQSTNSLFSGDHNEPRASRRVSQAQSKCSTHLIDPESLLKSVPVQLRNNSFFTLPKVQDF